MGQLAEALLPVGISIDVTQNIIAVPMVFSPAVTVQPGYRYYLTGFVQNQNSSIYGIKVFYSPTAP